MANQKKSKISYDSQKTVIYDNTVGHIISIMPDTLRVKLRSFEDSIRSKGSLLNDVGLVLAPLAALVTSSGFSSFAGLSGETWKAIFLLLFLYALFNLAKNIMQRFRKHVTADDIISQLTDESKKK
jgi:hypothetical protein